MTLATTSARASGKKHDRMTTIAVTDRSALAAGLRQLKLSGMLDTLDALLTQVHAWGRSVEAVEGYRGGSHAW